MIDWVARAKTEFSQRRRVPTDEADETPSLSSVSSVPLQPICGEREVSSVSSVGVTGLSEKRGVTMAMAWADIDIARFKDRRARLLRWGWNERDAEALAERLTRRDAGDDRRMCVECHHCMPGLVCAKHRAAGVGRELGRDLATMLQHCPAFAPTAAAGEQEGRP